jgi:bifunctional NMN adenylyltransferase/nudix hydrolase
MTMPFPFDMAILIGRFQPFHRGHAALLGKALASAPRVTVVLGSALGARTTKNPFTWQERAAMISATLAPEDRTRVGFIPVRDYYDSVLWAKAVDLAVRGVSPKDARTVLVGHHKDASSYYLDLFPRWAYLGAGAQGDICATELRRLFYEGEASGIAQAMESLPATLQGTFTGWLRSAEYSKMREAHLAIQESQKTWGRGPFITLDAVVQACGHILLVRRGRHPGKDLWAVPGGFLEPEERLLDGALRELHEETGLDLNHSPSGFELKEVAVFDHPDRSQRGRTVTHAHYFQLSDSALPAVSGSDDAVEARWIPLPELQAMEDQFFDDHFHILDHFLSISPDQSQQ